MAIVPHLRYKEHLLFAGNDVDRIPLVCPEHDVTHVTRRRFRLYAKADFKSLTTIYISVSL